VQAEGKSGKKNVDNFPFALVGWALGGEEMADALREVVGDGGAKVSVGLDMGDKDFGNGYGASVMVTLTCDQSADGVNEAIEVATLVAKEGLEKNFDRASDLYDKIGNRFNRTR